MNYKEWLSAAAIILTAIAYYPFIRAIYQDKVRPHVFSWIIWGCTTIIAFFAQVQDNGGAGAIPIGISGIITIFVAWLAYSKRSDLTIQKPDWFFLILALSSLPLWYFTSDPLWAVILLTAADILGFGPTLRKAYYFPWEEDLTFYTLFTIRNAMAIVALENYSITTMLFPVAISFSTIILIVVLIIRRSTLKG